MSAPYYEAIGRRKTSRARVRVALAEGGILVNGKPAQEYFPRLGDLEQVLSPLRLAGREGNVTVSVVVQGGGVTGQASAVSLGLARALLKLDPAYRPAFRKEGLLTRDDRMKERKKPGLKRARKAPTYTKR